MKTLNTVLFQSEDNTIWILLHSFIQSGLTAEITIGAGSKQRLQTEQILARDTLLCWANTHTFLLIIRLKTSFLSSYSEQYIQNYRIIPSLYILGVPKSVPTPSWGQNSCSGAVDGRAASQLKISKNKR